MAQANNLWLKWISEIQAIAQNGMAYSKNDFDIERYIRLRELAAEMATHRNEKSLEETIDYFILEKGYATPKIDIRSFVLENNRLLMVRERSDGLWTLPGGWADINESPSESAARETFEEAGYRVSVKRLLALWDKMKHDHPPQWPHLYKCFFHCEILDGSPKESLEISAVDFFQLDKLPPLSIQRVTKKQIERLYEAVLNSTETLYD